MPAVGAAVDRGDTVISGAWSGIAVGAGLLTLVIARRDCWRASASRIPGYSDTPEMHRWNPRMGTSLRPRGGWLLLADGAACHAIELSQYWHRAISGSHPNLLSADAGAGSPPCWAFSWRKLGLFTSFLELTLIRCFSHRPLGRLPTATVRLSISFSIPWVGRFFTHQPVSVRYRTRPHIRRWPNIAKVLQTPEQTQILIFLGFLVGFGVKMPIFPVHGWLPLARKAPSPVIILLSGILLKMGSMVLIRATGFCRTARWRCRAC